MSGGAPTLAAIVGRLGGTVKKWADFVLRHRKWVVSVWGLVFVAGVLLAGRTTDRLTVDFSLPGQPGTEAADKIQKIFGNGGTTNPYLVTVTLPAGQKIS